MAAGKSIFGKAVGFAAGLLGAGSAQAAVTPAKAPDVVTPTDAEVEAGLSSLRLVVRDAGYAARRNRILAERGAQPDDVIFATPYATGLELIVVADSAQSGRPWMLRDFARVQLTQDEVMTRARRQVLALLPPLPTAEKLVGNVVALPKADYLASLMLADGWDDLDAALDGHMRVVVPADDLLMAIDAREADLRTQLPAFVRAKFDDANRAISPLIYRRQNGAWVAVE